ncbi:MAG: FG-GAP repeat domain-containing protein [Candidatus Eiseniibacteriota bacterium]
MTTIRMSAAGAAFGVLLAAGCAVRDETVPAAQPADNAVPGAAAATHDGGPLNQKHARLLAIARQLQASDNMYFGLANLEALEDADTTGFTAERMAQHEFGLAFELFKHGRAEEAEAHFQSSFDRNPSPLTGYLLGITQLRIGELQNCVHHHSTASCVFPLQGSGVHASRGGTERALGTFIFLVDRAPVQLRPQARWFANISKMALGDYPGDLHPKVVLPARTLESDYDIGRFSDLAGQLGFASFNLAGGVAIEDFDRDGFLDVFVSTANPEGQMRYWRGTGDGTFTERTEEAGILGQLGGLNIVHADYDGDGWRDLLVLRGGWLGTYGRMPKSLLRNRGDGTFEDVTARAGLERVDYPVQNASFGD